MGNSLTSGIGATSHASNYPTQLAGLVGGGYRVVNLGIPNQTTSDMTSDAVAQVDPWVSWPAGGSTLIARENTNDIEFWGVSRHLSESVECLFLSRQAGRLGQQRPSAGGRDNYRARDSQPSARDSCGLQHMVARQLHDIMRHPSG